jgi:hypothetical protein
MPCLGPGNRFLSGKGSRSPGGFAKIEIDAHGEISTNVFSARGEVIDKSSLPERIIVPGKFNRYYRDDVQIFSPQTRQKFASGE